MHFVNVESPDQSKCVFQTPSAASKKKAAVKGQSASKEVKAINRTVPVKRKAASDAAEHPNKSPGKARPPNVLIMLHGHCPLQHCLLSHASYPVYCLMLLLCILQALELTSAVQPGNRWPVTIEPLSSQENMCYASSICTCCV